MEFLGADQNQLWDVDGTRYQENLLGLSHQSSGETYVRDPDTGAVHSMTKSGDKRFVLHDEKNSTLGLLSPDQKIERAYSYDPDGNATVTGTGPKSVVQWVGGVNLDNQGIYHFGARLYNPAIGRWTQPDPINQPSDLRQANLYAYAGCDPINNVDATGMFIDDVYDWVEGAANDAKNIVKNTWRSGPLGRCALGAVVGGAVGAPWGLGAQPLELAWLRRRHR